MNDLCLDKWLFIKYVNMKFVKCFMFVCCYSQIAQSGDSQILPLTTALAPGKRVLDLVEEPSPTTNTFEILLHISWYSLFLAGGTSSS